MVRQLASFSVLRISADVDHPFRLKPITRFGGRRSPVSVMAIRRFG
jgi:hypothetical protein